MKRICKVIAACLFAAPTWLAGGSSASAQELVLSGDPIADAQTIMAERRRREIAQWRNVDSYMVKHVYEVPGAEIQQGNTGPLLIRNMSWTFYEKLTTGPNQGYRIVPHYEIADRLDGFDGAIARKFRGEMTEKMGIGLHMMSEEMQSTAPGEAAVAGVLSQGMGAFLIGNAGANIQRRNDIKDNSAYLGMQKFAGMARYAGLSRAQGGADVHVLRADNLDMHVSEVENQELPVCNLSNAKPGGECGEVKTVYDQVVLSLDQQTLMPLQLVVRGRFQRLGPDAKANKREEWRDFTVERFDDDYRKVNGMLLPYKTIQRFSFSTSGEERAELDKAKRDLERIKAERSELEKRLMELPPAQAAMIRNMLESKLAQAEKALGGDDGRWTFETTTYVADVMTGWAEDLSTVLGHN